MHVRLKVQRKNQKNMLEKDLSGPDKATQMVNISTVVPDTATQTDNLSHQTVNLSDLIADKPAH
jgi:hypothetical protein